MIIYGTGGKKLLTVQIADKCPQCASEDSLEITITARYFHLFWIPFFPIGKKSVVYCTRCGFGSEIPTSSEQINEKSSELEFGLRTPAYLFSGLVLALLVTVFTVFRGIDKDKRLEEYVHSPKAGDVYEIKTPHNYYSLLKIVYVKGDSIYVRYNSYETDRKSGLADLKKNKGYQDEVYAYSKLEILEVYKAGDIINIERTEKIDVSNLLSYDIQYPQESGSIDSLKSGFDDSVKATRPQAAKK